MTPIADAALELAAAAVNLDLDADVPGAAASSSRNAAELEPLKLTDLPNDLLVTIFVAVKDRTWVRLVIPFVCKRFSELCRSRDASPLHEELFLLFDGEAEMTEWKEAKEGGPPPAPCGSRVIAWAMARAASVRKLAVLGPAASAARAAHFSSRDLAELVFRLAPTLEDINIAPQSHDALLDPPFWVSLRACAAPGELRELYVQGMRRLLSESDVAPLGKLTSLEVLKISIPEDEREAALGVPWGLRRFPEGLCKLTGLRRLALDGHAGVTSVPPAISALQNLEQFSLEGCPVRSLPKEIGTLKKLEVLNLMTGSGRSGRRAIVDAEAAFPPELAGMTSLTALDLENWGLRTVPSFVKKLHLLIDLRLGRNKLGEAAGGNGGFPASFPKLESLIYLDLSGNDLRFVPPAVLSSMPRLEQLVLWSNRLTDLPDGFGKALPMLKKLWLDENFFAALPARALRGAAALEELHISRNDKMEISQPLLDLLFDKFPRLRLLNVVKTPFFGAKWNNSACRRLAAFEARLRARIPGSEVVTVYKTAAPA